VAGRVKELDDMGSQMSDAAELSPVATRSRDGQVIGLIGIASHFYMLLLPPLFAYIRADYGVGYAELGIAISVFNVVSAMLQTPAGFMVDRVGAPKVLIAGLIIGAGGVTLVAAIPSYWALVAGFAIAGLANTVYHPADYSILSHRVATKRIGQAFSIHSCFGMLGSAAAPATMLVLASHWGWRSGLLAAAGLAIAVAILLIVQTPALVGRGPAATQARSGAERDKGGSDWRLLFSRPILRNLFFFVLLSMAGGGLSSFSVVALGDLYGTPLTVANLALSGFLLMNAAGILLGGVIADRTIYHNRVAALGFAGSALVVLSIGVIGFGSALLIASMAFAGLLNGIIVPSRDMMVRAVTPHGAFGKVFGFVSTGFNLGGIVAPLIFGWLMDQQHPRAVFLLVVACILLSLVTVSTAPQRARPAVAAAAS
jgi:FSR family fosmidomycin resistance protein-like MFS transporter